MRRALVLVSVLLVACQREGGAPSPSAAPAARAELPQLGTLPPFELTAQTGQPFGSRQLAGQPYVANFIFTRCPMVCPRLSAQMASLQQATADMKTGLRLVSFSVDPEYDTPERLLAYGAQYHADFARWTFLTGSLAQVQDAVVNGLKMTMDGVTPGKEVSPAAVLHGTRFVLVDGRGEIRGYYDSSDADAMERLRRDARQLAATSSQGGARLN